MTEMSFLLELLLNEKLSKTAKEKITARIKEVETMLNTTRITIPAGVQIPQALPPAAIVNGAMQSPSTIAALQRQAAAGVPAPDAQRIGQHEEAPAVVIASPAAAQAIHSRQVAIGHAISGKPEQGRTSPRKF